MINYRIKRVLSGIVFISTLAASSFSYADADSLKLESDIKKLQNEIKSIQQTQIKLELELDKLNQNKLSPEYTVATAKKIGHRGRR
ncbi:hypothetical protein [Bathymodiolus platifrons methanotrophic gill symbiont]|uniref:hypothetical protein n=1 Tax=Bathymodiolus platifrons methanotrophic gill symbiont TaxID=113268 RepID=UPI001C8E3076|nr:hypothetical protein [Bathymodiolus platifrons methanotrophic gill symbiont]